MTAHTLFLTAASLSSAETQDVTPVTTLGNSQVGTESKLPVSETPSWTISDRSDSSTIVADSANDRAAFEHAREHGWVLQGLVLPTALTTRADTTPLPMARRTWI